MIRPAFMLSALALAACGGPAPSTSPPQTNSAAPLPEVTTSGATPPPAPSGAYFATPAPGEELPTSQTTPGPIPLKFRAVWAMDLADCTKDPGLTRIAIAPGAIRFYEGRAVVVNAEVQGGDVLILDVDHMSEGETRRERHTLGLTDAGESRLMYQRRGESFNYIRCSA